MRGAKNGVLISGYTSFRGEIVTRARIFWLSADMVLVTVVYCAPSSNVAAYEDVSKTTWYCLVSHQAYFIFTVSGSIPFIIYQYKATTSPFQ